MHRPKNPRGISVLSVIVTLLLLGIFGIAVNSLVIKVMQKAFRSQHLSTLHIAREKIFKNIDCDATLATANPPLPPASSPVLENFCSTDLKTQKSPYLQLINLKGESIFDWDSFTQTNLYAGWNIRVSCYKYTGDTSGNVYKWILVHYGRYKPGSNTEFVTNPDTGLEETFTNLYEFPLNCWERNLAGGSTPIGSSSTGSGSGSGSTGSSSSSSSTSSTSTPSSPSSSSSTSSPSTLEGSTPASPGGSECPPGSESCPTGFCFDIGSGSCTLIPDQTRNCPPPESRDNGACLICSPCN